MLALALRCIRWIWWGCCEVDVVVCIQVDQVDGGVDDYVDVVVAFEVDQVDGVGGKRV